MSYGSWGLIAIIIAMTFSYVIFSYGNLCPHNGNLRQSILFTLIKILTDQLSFDRGEIEILNKNVELQHGSDSVEQIYALMKENKIEAIHSSEPNLETVFLELTGRKLQEEE